MNGATGSISGRVVEVALDRALAQYPDYLAHRAAAALRLILHEHIKTKDAQAWTSSRLTGDGYPVELSFTTTDDRLRYTAEPASWCVASQHRLDKVIQLLNSLAFSAIPEDVIAAFQCMQTRGNLDYGAWLGGRHGPTDNNYKIYVETPDVASPCDANEAMLIKYPQPRLPDRVAKLRMIAYSPAIKRWEVYFRIQAMAPHHVARVLAPCGLESRAEDLLRYISDAYGYALRSRLPGGSVGVSYSMQSPQEPLSVTLFFFARVLWGGDGRIRQHFGRLSTELGWDDSCYQRITADLALHRSWTTHHGIFGITLTRTGEMSISIGVRPPETMP